MFSRVLIVVFKDIFCPDIGSCRLSQYNHSNAISERQRQRKRQRKREGERQSFLLVFPKQFTCHQNRTIQSLCHVIFSMFCAWNSQGPLRFIIVFDGTGQLNIWVIYYSKKDRLLFIILPSQRSNSMSLYLGVCVCVFCGEATLTLITGKQIK